MSELLLEMRGICKQFPGVKALDGVSLKVKAGTVHALMGENGAGKSTLMKCLFGIYTPDAGEIRLDGQLVQLKNPRQALDHGIAMIHQELHPVKDRSVMENLWLGRFPLKKWGPLSWVDHEAMYRESQKVFAELGLPIDPKVLIGSLSVSKIQSIEIAKAVSQNAKIIVMDEPTSSLTGDEVERLFAVIRDLQKRGVAIIYISHKMEEILQIADDVTIMRDGGLVGCWPAKELTIDTIISKMVGRDLSQRFPPKSHKIGEEWFRVEGFSSPLPNGIKDVSFSLRRGEILGIGGLVGSQRTELIETMFGLRSLAKGKISIEGKTVNIRSSRDAIQHKMALLTEERRATGIFPSLSILENTVIAHQGHYVCRGGWLEEAKRRADTARSIQELHVKTPSMDTAIKNLSGGNQQKVLLARWLLTEPELLLLDEPTRGIDVGAKQEIYSIIFELARRGKTIVVISSEMPELIGLSDRIAVMCEGRLSGILSGEEASEEKILRLATQFMTPAANSQRA